MAQLEIQLHHYCDWSQRSGRMTRFLWCLSQQYESIQRTRHSRSLTEHVGRTLTNARLPSSLPEIPGTHHRVIIVDTDQSRIAAHCSSFPPKKFKASGAFPTGPMGSRSVGINWMEVWQNCWANKFSYTSDLAGFTSHEEKESGSGKKSFVIDDSDNCSSSIEPNNMVLFFTFVFAAQLYNKCWWLCQLGSNRFR